MPADLEKDKKKFFEYTLRMSLTTELLLEDHLAELIALGAYADKPEEFKEVWHETTFCKDCILDHALEESGFASECITGACPALPEWQELYNVSIKLYEYLLPLTEMSDYTPQVFNKVAEYDHKLRQIRKKLEEAGVEFATKNKNDMIDDKEHIGV